MPALARKIIIIAAVDGLVLQPAHQRNQRALHIEYTTQKITPIKQSPTAGNASIDSHGIVGLLSVPSSSFLIAITHRQQVAQIRGSPIYALKDVVILPLASQAEASAAITQAKAAVKRKPGLDDDSDDDLSEAEEDTENDTATDNESVGTVDTQPEADLREQRRRSSNVVQDVIGKKGAYGRFAERWFSRKGWIAERRMAQGMSIDSAQTESESTTQESHGEESSVSEDPQKPRRVASSGAASPALPLLPKLLRTTRMLLSSQAFFFSYDIDISRCFGRQDPQRNPETPLYTSFESIYFWNRHLMKPFIDEAHHPFVLPVMQGFVGQRSFILSREANDAVIVVPTSDDSASDSADSAAQHSNQNDDNNFLLTLISRRSVERPGLRYLRRGVDDEGHTANTVETEQILSRASWTSSRRTHSLTQLRGSIPVFFSQSPYSFKPVPTLQHSENANLSAFKRHFSQIKQRYGDTHVVLLTDKKGPEGAIGEKYQNLTQQINEEGGISGCELGFKWFDFHKECSGMRFDNIKFLIEDVHETLDEFGSFIEVSGVVESQQRGIMRTNCMDCLDRTNVVQTGFAQRALEGALRKEGFDMNFHTDTSTQWFNSLWADNGDAVSKQYSSTAALKGDFTRTRKRDYRGAINDLSLTLSRYYNNIVNDYFSQTTIDFLLGNVNVQVFEDFEENMMTRDPGMSIQKVRDNAINTSAKIVIADSSEDLVSGWTLLSPREPNSIRILPVEESVLLLTDAALYKVCFDWSIEKVSCFERVELGSISSILKGTYVTSTLTASQTDEGKNVGFVINYRPGKADISRVNTRSLSTTPGLSETASRSMGQARTMADEHEQMGSPSVDKVSGSRILAFKALPSRSSVVNDKEHGAVLSERQVIDDVCGEIRRVAGYDDQQTGAIPVKEGGIVTAQEARRSTGLVEQWAYSLKRLVWG